MQNILTGIYSAYNANAALKAALPGGLHLELAPQETAMTYATYQVINGRPDYMFADEYFEIVWAQFDIYAETNALRQTAYDRLTDVYDDARITATGYAPIIFERINFQFLRDGDQNKLHRAIVEYKGTWKKS